MMTKQLRKDTGYPVSTLCETLGLSRSSYYHKHRAFNDAEILSQIKGVQAKFPVYGSRRVAKELGREPYRIKVNRKRAQRIMRENDLLQPVKKAKTITTNSQHGYPRYPNLVKDLVVFYPDQVWVSDITYIRFSTSFIYLAVIMDIFTRSIRGWQLSRSIDQQLTLDALKMALSDRVPKFHHSDQGVQYAAHRYTDLLKKYSIEISMATIGKAEENGYAERLMRTIKEEEVDLTEYEDFSDAYAQIGHFIEKVYQYKRIHSSLGYLTPAEFEEAWTEERHPQPLLP